MSPIHVVGIGLEGLASLTDATRDLLAQATLLVGSERHLSYVTDFPAPRLPLADLTSTLEQVQEQLQDYPHGPIVILVSGDPLFFGLGRLLLTVFPPDQLTFHPHLSAIQLAFSRLKLPWHDAQVISAHGRSLEQLPPLLQQGKAKIAILTDTTHTPGAIARLLSELDLPLSYQMWVCENLGGPAERVQLVDLDPEHEQPFAPLNLVILLRTQPKFLVPPSPASLPLLGLKDQSFCSFADRPGLMTKREVRVLALAELALQPSQVIWDIGAGTGSVSIEIARLVPDASIYAVEKTAAGLQLIQQNCDRFGVHNIQVVPGMAPKSLVDLPRPNRIFIGGSGGDLPLILDHCQTQLLPEGRIVLAIATLEHLHLALDWFNQHHWSTSLLQVQLSRSVSVAALTRLAPLNPVTLLRATLSRE